MTERSPKGHSRQIREDSEKLPLLVISVPSPKNVQQITIKNNRPYLFSFDTHHSSNISNPLCQISYN